MSIPHRTRARKFLEWLAREPDDWKISFHGASVVSDDVVDRLAEVIADAQDELREGFLRRTRKNEAKTHG